MHSRVPSLFAFVLTLVLGSTLLLPAMRATASTELPFEIVFPQEVAKTEFSSTYGQYRSGGRAHKGNDLLAPRMTEVYAVADGTIIHVGTSRLAGRNLRIDHGDGWTSHYVHLNNDNIGTDDGAAPWTLTVAPGVELGRTVKKGQLIGWVGDSGNAEGTTPHTHFELRMGNQPINPYSILVEAYERDLVYQTALLSRLEATFDLYLIE